MYTDEVEGRKTREVPPYISFRTLTGFLSYLKEHGTPARIDKTAMPNYSGGTKAQLLQALRFLDLTDEQGNSTETLRNLVQADDDERRDMLHRLLTRHYSAFMPPEFDPQTTTMAQLEERFQSYGINGSTVNKCIQFFLRLCQEAGIEVSRHVLRIGGAARSSSRKGNGRRKKSDAVEPENTPSPRKPEAPIQEFPALQNEMIRGLVKSLPAPGSAFGAAKRQRWLTFAGNLFDFVYGDEGESGEDNDQT